MVPTVPIAPPAPAAARRARTWVARTLAAGALAAVLSAATTAAAQSAFGDTRLSYSGGVVYDDDLVPGLRPNQPYLVDEQVRSGAASGAAGGPATMPATRQPSANLIAADGRIVPSERAPGGRGVR